MHASTNSPKHEPGTGPGKGVAFAGVGAALLMIACCAAPALLAAGVLAGVGAWIANPWVITAAALLAGLAIAAMLWHRRAGEDCCVAPTSDDPKSGGVNRCCEEGTRR